MHAMSAFGAPTALIDVPHLTRADAVTQLGSPPIRIDLLASISGVTFERAAIDAVVVEIAGETLPVIGLEALRANKRATRRRKDRDDLRYLPEAPPSDATPRTRKRLPRERH